MNKFVAMVILKPDISKRKIDFIQSGITNLFEQNSKVQKVWFLGKRNLDYKIKKYNEGIYLKIEILGKSKKLDKVREELKLNDNVIFSIIIKNDNEKNSLSILKKHSLPFNKTPQVNRLETNQASKKIYMLISKNTKLPFAESDIIAISEDEKKLYQFASKKIQDYIYVKGFRTMKPFKIVKDIENELKKCWKVQFASGNNTNIMQELLIREKSLI